MPQKVCVWSLSSIASFARPKSVIRTCEQQRAVEGERGEREDARVARVASVVMRVARCDAGIWAHVALGVEQHVLGLEVAIYNLERVEVVYGRGDLRSVEPRARLVEPPGLRAEGAGALGRAQARPCWASIGVEWRGAPP